MQENYEDEIDLRELAAQVWAGRYLIAATTAVTVSLSALYAFTAEPIYEAKSVFALESGGRNSVVPSEFAGVASILGVEALNPDSTIYDYLSGRDFVERLSPKVSLFADDFLNPPQQEPSFISAFIQSLEPTQSERRPNDIDRIFKAYTENILFDETENGSISVTVRHRDAERSAEIANAIVNQVLEETKEDNRQSSKEVLEHLSEATQEAYAELLRAQQEVSAFAIAQNIGVGQDFVNRTQLIDSLRKEIELESRIRAALTSTLRVLDATSNPSQADLDRLRRDAPEIDSAGFRRLVRLPEGSLSWTWPSKSAVQAALTTSDAQLTAKQRDLDNLKIEAEQFARSSEEYLTLQMDAEIEEASYSALLAQLDQQSVILGLNPKVASVYQSAFVPIEPAQPQKLLILALGLVLGLFTGVFLAIIRCARRRSYFTRSSLQQALGATLQVHTPDFQRMRRTFASASDAVAHAKSAELAELAVFLRTRASKLIVVIATGPGISALPSALWISSKLASGGKAKLLQIGDASPASQKFVAMDDGVLRKSTSKDLDWFVPSDQTDPTTLVSESFMSKLEGHFADAQNDQFKLTIAVSHDLASAVVRALFEESASSESAPILVAVSRTGKTDRKIVERIREMIPFSIGVDVT